MQHREDIEESNVTALEICKKGWWWNKGWKQDIGENSRCLWTAHSRKSQYNRSLSMFGSNSWDDQHFKSEQEDQNRDTPELL